jgi:hypothetical protein
MDMIPTQVSNMDVADLCDRACSFAREMGTSQSAYNGGAMEEYDINRAADYYDSLETMLGIYEANPLDMPKSHNIGFSLLKTFLTDDEVEAIENMPVKAQVRTYQALWFELANSQSADQITGIKAPDAVRIRAILKKGRDLLSVANEMLDLPENHGNSPVPEGATAGRSRTRNRVRTLRG